MARIAVDCDGVLANFNTAAIQVAHKLFPDKFPLDLKATSWDWIDGAEADAMWAEIRRTPNWWLKLEAYRDQVEDFAKFLSETTTHEVWIVTSRSPVAGLTVARQTELWLQHCGIFDLTYDYLGIITVPHPSNKVKLYKTLEIDYSVDDKTETVEQCDKLEGHKAFLLTRPWNVDAKVQNRVDKLGGMFDIIKREGK